jgi:hypothetical protein
MGEPGSTIRKSIELKQHFICVNAFYILAIAVKSNIKIHKREATFDRFIHFRYTKLHIVLIGRRSMD